MSLIWTPSRWTTKAEMQLALSGDRADVVRQLEALGYTEANGYEIDEFTDQIDVLQRIKGHRRIRLILMP